MKKRVLITGIGGNVGQGILRNIINLQRDIILIGTNTDAVSAGNHLCDKFYQVPFSNTPEYIPVIKDICSKENIDLIIPSTDFETYYLARAKDELPEISSSDEDVSFMFFNKYKTWQEFKKFDIPFAETCLPSEYNNNFEECVVKPSEGRGSREININPSNPQGFSDDHVVQKLYKGKEITVSFYVTKSKKLLGMITLLRSLSHGATDKCEVIFDYDQMILSIVNNIIQNFNVKGSCNLQAIVTDDEEIIPFEINGRISGTNSIRAQFGFEDVRYTIEEYLFNEKPQKPQIKKGAAVRILMDVIYPNISLDEVKDNSVEHYIY